MFRKRLKHLFPQSTALRRVDAPVGTRTRPALGLVLTVLACAAAAGCTDASTVEGTWAGVVAGRGGEGYYFRLRVDAVHAWLRGSGAAVVYDRPGAAPDTTIGLRLRGYFRGPELTLALQGDVPGFEGEVLTFEGILSDREDELEGVLVPDSLSRIPLVLERQDEL